MTARSKGTGPAAHRPAGRKDYSALSIWVQAQAARKSSACCRRKLLAAAEGFVGLRSDYDGRRAEGRIADRKFFHEFVRECSAPPQVPAIGTPLRDEGPARQAEVDAILERLELSGSLPAEKLEVDTMLLCSRRAGGSAAE